MLEPVLDLKHQQDSLDIMLEMHMQQTLNHPVIIEVLNLVYEGQYSVDSSLIALSQTMFCFFSLKTFDQKSLTDRLILNIKTFGEFAGERQSSLQYNIWKYCIQ